MSRRRWWVGAVLLATIASSSRADEPNGRALYVAYCASCHGTDARGDGVDAEMFVPPPRDLRSGFLAKYSDDELVARIREGRPLPLARDKAALEVRAAEAETIVHHMERLPSIDWRRAERGQELYVERCEICHGPFGHAPATLPPGVTRTPRDLSDPAYQRTTTDATLLERVRHGHRGMPAIPGLDQRENAEALLAFVRLLSPGFDRYSRYCAACHGDDGRGPAADWATEQRPAVVFDRAYFAKTDPESLRRKAWHMLADERPAMPHLRREVRAADARAIIGYLRSLPAE